MRNLILSALLANHGGAQVRQVSESGWTIPVPKPFNAGISLTALTQTGSRIYYIDQELGDNATGMYYLWNGEALVDNTGSLTGVGGVPYGNDPLNPTGPIRPFSSFYWVSNRAGQYSDGFGTEIGPGTQGTGSNTPAYGRASMPDFRLFARGKVFNFDVDQFAFFGARNTTTLGLNPGGCSDNNYNQVYGSYGPLTLDRALLQNGRVVNRNYTAVTPYKNVLTFGIAQEGRGQGFYAGTPMESGFILGAHSNADNVLFEDVIADGGANFSIDGNGHYRFRRSTIIDAHRLVVAGAHIQGLLYYGRDEVNSSLELDECILARNGMKGLDPNVTWPPTSSFSWDVFDRNLYLSGTCDHLRSHFNNCVSLIGSSGDQFRCGMQVEGSFFYQGYIGMRAHGGDLQANTGSFKNSVLQNFKAVGFVNNNGHPGWGLDITGGSRALDISGSIITNAQNEAWGSEYKIRISPPGAWAAIQELFLQPTRENVVTGNIFLGAAGTQMVQVVDGSNEIATTGYVFPGIVNNSVVNNIFTGGASMQSTYTILPGAEGSTDPTTYSGNTFFATTADAMAALGWIAPNRTLKTYLQSIGVSVTSDDGVYEYVALAKLSRRGNWNPALLAKPIINHIRMGFGWPALV